jgi:hypothetical protein
VHAASNAIAFLKAKYEAANKRAESLLRLKNEFQELSKVL